MANRSTAFRRIALMSLAVAGALAGSAGGAASQYYYYDEPAPYPLPYGYGYGYSYGYRHAPRVAEPVTPYDIRRIAAEDYGFVRIDRLSRTADTYVVDGMRANGQRQRLVLDAFADNLIRRTTLRSGQIGQPPDVARIDPREEREPARPRLVPKPPERPAALKPPGQANAPATVVPPSPAAPPPPAVPEQAAPQPPAEASAPATQSPPPAAAPAAPSPGPANPETGADKPKLVNPQDVRGTDGADRQPPLSQASPDPVPLAPVQNDDATPASPKPETPIAPVAPLQ